MNSNPDMERDVLDSLDAEREQTYSHATDNLDYVVRDRATGEDLAYAETVDGARLAAETLSAERGAAADWHERKPDPNRVTILDEAARFDVWYDGERTVERVSADSLADAVRIVVERYGSARGFSPLGRRDVTVAGGDWTDRAFCSCDVEDDGDGESGPHLAISGLSETCDLHGRVVDPSGWEESERFDRMTEDRVTLISDPSDRVAAERGVEVEPSGCEICGEPVTSKDPVRYPYCRNCHYTGQAQTTIRAEQVAYFQAAFPGSTVNVEHTGGGCFWMAIRWPNLAKYIVLTDGDASLPYNEDGEPIRGGWGYIGRHDDTDDASNPDYEGTDFFYGPNWEDESKATTCSDAEAVEKIRASGILDLVVAADPDLDDARSLYAATAAEAWKTTADHKRTVLVHLNIEIAADDHRTVDEIADAVALSVEVGVEGTPEYAPGTVTIALSEEV